MRYILIILWLLLGIGYYILANNFSEPLDAIDKVITSENIVPSITSEEVPCPAIGPYSFKQNSTELIKGVNWESYKDSLIRLVTQGKKLQIIGLETEGEKEVAGVEDLGMQRANTIADLMGIEKEKLQLYSNNLGKVKFNLNCKIPGAKIKIVTVTEKIKEVQDRTLIYFPYNSTNKLNDAEVETYLDEVALEVIKADYQIQLIGHTDNIGDPEYNLSLGQSRAEKISAYLISKNVPEKNIIAISKGETMPIADNATKVGRAENRRTELKILK